MIKNVYWAAACNVPVMLVMFWWNSFSR